jgi:hypothetical protein
MGEFSYLTASASAIASQDFRFKDGSTFREWYDSNYRDWWADPMGDRATMRIGKTTAV